MIEKPTAEVFRQLNDFEEKHAPARLFLAGDDALLREGRRVAVVGSRKATPEAAARARALTARLVEAEVTIVSGLAAGIDTVAHETAIERGGRTIAVLGSGLDRAYPVQNAALLQTIKDAHLAVSQFAPGAPMKRENFPRRNRTMALLSDATIIVSAQEESGTRSQGWEALRLGRDLYFLESVITDGAPSWAKEMIDYGAEVLTRENLPQMIEALPHPLAREFALAF